MKSIKILAALIASAGLLWGTVHAAGAGTAEALPEVPDVIILELQPMMPGDTLGGELGAGSEQEQMMLGVLLLQLLSAMQAEGESIEIQLVEPQSGQRI